MSETASDGTVADARPVDLVFLALPPAVLVAVFILPAGATDGWRLVVLDPTVRAAYLSHFVHGSAGHLLSNLAGYALLAPLTYALCLSAGRRREFLAVLATFLLALPFALSALNVALSRPSIVYGFSGVVMALLGFVPLAVGWHVEARFHATVGGSVGPLAFFVGAGVIAAVAVPSSPLSLAAVAIAVAAAVTYLRSAASGAGGVRRLVTGRDLAAPGRVEFAAVGILIVVVFPLSAFPPVTAGSLVVPNLFGHAMGYCLGFLAPYVAFTLLDRRDDGDGEVPGPAAVGPGAVLTGGRGSREPGVVRNS